MAESTKFTLRSLRSLKRMPLPSAPRVKDYGRMYVGESHDIQLFPAAVRQSTAAEVENIIEEGESSCFFHPKLPATDLCEISGRLICGLCKTEWNGQTVSFEALQSALKEGGSATQSNRQTRWDNIALSLALLPLLIWVITIVTAPVVLGIVLWRFRKGPCSRVHRSGWRYSVAALMALLQIGFWVFLFLSDINI